MSVFPSRTKKLAISTLVAFISLGVFATGAQAEWSPKKPVEFIIMAGTGGGADQIARLLQGLIEKKGLSPRPFIPINKPGGSGGEALRYLKDKAGDDHVLLVTLNSFYTTPIIQTSLGVDPTTFTPVGRMAWIPSCCGLTPIARTSPISIPTSRRSSPPARAGKWAVPVQARKIPSSPR